VGGILNQGHTYETFHRGENRSYTLGSRYFKNKKQRGGEENLPNNAKLRVADHPIKGTQGKILSRAGLTVVFDRKHVGGGLEFKKKRAENFWGGVFSSLSGVRGPGTGPSIEKKKIKGGGRGKPCLGTRFAQVKKADTTFFLKKAQGGETGGTRRLRGYMGRKKGNHWQRKGQVAEFKRNRIKKVREADLEFQKGGGGVANDRDRRGGEGKKSFTKRSRLRKKIVKDHKTNNENSREKQGGARRKFQTKGTRRGPERGTRK